MAVFDPNFCAHQQANARPMQTPARGQALITAHMAAPPPLSLPRLGSVFPLTHPGGVRSAGLVSQKI